MHKDDLHKYHRSMQCDGSKNSYGSYRAAVTAMRASQKSKRLKGPRPIRVYKCSCGCWHITSMKTFQ